MLATRMPRKLSPWLLVGAGVLATPCLAAEDDYRIAAGTRPLEQSVWLKLDPAQDSYEGRVQITLERTQAGKRLQFNGLD